MYVSWQSDISQCCLNYFVNLHHTLLLLLSPWRPNWIFGLTFKGHIFLTPVSCTLVRYWSKVLQRTTLTLLSDINIKVMDLENYELSHWMFWLKFFSFLNSWLDCSDTCTVVKFWSKVLLSITSSLFSDLDAKVLYLKNRGFSDWTS